MAVGGNSVYSQLPRRNYTMKTSDWLWDLDGHGDITQKVMG